MAREVFQGLQPRAEGRIGRDEGQHLETRRLMGPARDDLERALSGEVEQPARGTGAAEIDVAGYGRHRDRLTRTEGHRLHGQAFGGEIVFFDRNIERPGARVVNEADLDGFGIGPQRRQNKKCENGQETDDRLHQ